MTDTLRCNRNTPHLAHDYHAPTDWRAAELLHCPGAQLLAHLSDPTHDRAVEREEEVSHG